VISTRKELFEQAPYFLGCPCILEQHISKEVESAFSSFPKGFVEVPSVKVASLHQILFTFLSWDDFASSRTGSHGVSCIFLGFGFRSRVTEYIEVPE
jgi:hypothetical protein